MMGKRINISDEKNITSPSATRKEEEAPEFDTKWKIEDTSGKLTVENRLIQTQNLETIGIVASGIAHDFNNVLVTISGYAEMLHDDLFYDSELSEKVNKILEAVAKAQSIANKILTLGHQLGQEKVPVNVFEVISETIGFVKSSIPENIIVKCYIRLKNVNVLADPTQLFRLFLNLIVNAIRATEQTGGTISVNMNVIKGKLPKHELNKEIADREYILIIFKDTGTGIEASNMSRIFEPFFTTREAGNGAGLGLSVTHSIISELDGEILVSSKLGKGSVFKVYLPLFKKLS